MKLLLFASCIALFGCSASNPMNDLLHRMQRQIKQLEINDEALTKKYDGKIRSLEKSCEEKIARLEQQHGFGRNLTPQSGKVFHICSEKTRPLKVFRRCLFCTSCPLRVSK